MNTKDIKELAFDRNSRVLYIPGYAMDAFALIGEGRGDLACLTTIAIKLSTGTVPVPKDLPAAQRDGILRPTSNECLWLLNVRDAYAELERALIP